MSEQAVMGLGTSPPQAAVVSWEFSHNQEGNLMSSFETKTALGTPSANYDVAAEAVLISLITVLARQAESPNKFIWEIENEVKARLSPDNRRSSLEIAQEILSAAREQTLK